MINRYRTKVSLYNERVEELNRLLLWSTQERTNVVVVAMREQVAVANEENGYTVLSVAESEMQKIEIWNQHDTNFGLFYLTIFLLIRYFV